MDDRLFAFKASAGSAPLAPSRPRAASLRRTTGERSHCGASAYALLEAFQFQSGANVMAEQKTSPVHLAQSRPLSPHLMIYSPLLTMMMSIVHRITGAALYVGTLLLAWYVIALAAGPGPFATVAFVYGSILGRIVLFLFTWALFHHLLGGVRHFIWDLGYGMDHPVREYLAQGTLIGGLVLTAFVWGLATLLAFL